MIWLGLAFVLIIVVLTGFAFWASGVETRMEESADCGAPEGMFRGFADPED